MPPTDILDHIRSHLLAELKSHAFLLFSTFLGREVNKVAVVQFTAVVLSFGFVSLIRTLSSRKALLVCCASLTRLKSFCALSSRNGDGLARQF